jgi:hypothetical protein
MWIVRLITCPCPGKAQQRGAGDGTVCQTAKCMQNKKSYGTFITHNTHTDKGQQNPFVAAHS